MLFRRKRNGPWYTRVLIDGKWEKKSTRLTDRKAAERVLAERERAAADPANHAADSATFGSMIQSFLGTHDLEQRAKGTREMYDQKSRHLARLLGAGTKPARIDAFQVDKYCKDRLGEGASRNTIAKELITLRGVLRLAKRHKIYPHDLEAVIPKWDAGYKARETWLTPEQLNKLLCVLPPNRRHYVRWAIVTGGRHSELMSAVPGDVDRERGVIFVRSTKTRRKGQGDRYVPITPLTKVLLEGIVLPLETWEDGSRTRDLKAACKRAGVPRVTANDLRRTHASWLVQAGVNADTAGSVLGHSSSEMIKKVYGKTTPEALAANVINQIERGPSGTHMGHRNTHQPGERAPTGNIAACSSAYDVCEIWQGLGDSNPRPADLESAPIPTYCEELPSFLLNWDIFGTCADPEKLRFQRPGDRAAAKLLEFARQLSAGRLAWDSADGFALRLADGEDFG